MTISSTIHSVFNYIEKNCALPPYCHAPTPYPPLQTHELSVNFDNFIERSTPLIGILPITYPHTISAFLSQSESLRHDEKLDFFYGFANLCQAELSSKSHPIRSFFLSVFLSFVFDTLILSADTLPQVFRVITHFLTPNPLLECNFLVIQLVQQFLWNSLLRAEDLAFDIFSLISSVIRDARSQILNFFPFFIGLACRFDFPLVRFLRACNIFQALIDFSTDQLALFDLARHLVVLKPRDIFVDISVTHQIIAAFDFVFDLPACQNAVVDCYRAAFEMFTKPPYVFDSANRNFLCHFMIGIQFSLRSCLERSHSADGFKFLPILQRFAHALPSSIWEEGKCQELFMVIVKLSLEFPEHLWSVLNTFSSIFCAAVPRDIDFLTANTEFISLLSKCPVVVHVDINSLFHFLCSSNRIGQVIRNHRAIPLVVSFCSQSLDLECEMVKRFITLANSPLNIHPMYNGGLQELILLRLRVVQENDDLRNSYIALFQRISAGIFTRGLLSPCVRLLTDPGFLYATDILGAFVELLKIDPIGPKTFFRFDGSNGCEIKGAKFENLWRFWIAFSLRKIDRCEKFRALITLELGPEQIVVIGFTLNVLEIHSKTGSRQIGNEFEVDHWYGLVIGVDFGIPKKTWVAVSVDGNEFVRFDCGSRMARPTYVNVILANPSGGEGIIVELSTINFFRSQPPLDVPFDIFAQTWPGSVLFSVKPTAVEPDGSVPDVPAEVRFSADVVPFHKPFNRVFPKSWGVLNLLPLFQRLEKEPATVENEKTGQSLVVQLLTVIQLVIQARPSILEPIPVFDGLAAFLAIVHPRYFSLRVIDCLRRIYDALNEFSELRQIMIWSIWFNFEMINNWEPGFQEAFFQAACVFVHQLQNPPDDKRWYFIQSMLNGIKITAAIGLNHHFLTKFVMPVDCQRLVQFCMEAQTIESRNTGLSFLEVALTTHPRYCSPVILSGLLSLLDRFTQAPVIRCCMMISTIPNNKEWCDSAVYHCIVRLNPADDADIRAIKGLINCFLFDSQEHFLLYSVIFPFFVSFCIRFLSKDEGRLLVQSGFIPAICKFSEAANFLLDIPYWSHWFISLWGWTYGIEDVNHFMDLINIPELFSNDKIVCALLDYLELYESHQQVFLRNLKRMIFIRAFTTKRDFGNSLPLYQRAFWFWLTQSYYSLLPDVLTKPSLIEEKFMTLNHAVAIRTSFRIPSPEDTHFTRAFTDRLWEAELEYPIHPNLKEDSRVLSAVIFQLGLAHDQEQFEEFTLRFADSIETLSPESRSKIADCLMTALNRYEHDTPEIRARLGDLIQFPCFTHEFTVSLADPVLIAESFQQFQRAFVAHFREIYLILSDLSAMSGQYNQPERIMPLDTIRAGFFRGSSFAVTDDTKYKACNRISTRGRRILSVINHRFQPYDTDNHQSYDPVYRLKSYHISNQKLKLFHNTRVSIGGFRPCSGDLQILNGFVSFINADMIGKDLFLKFDQIQFVFVRPQRGAFPPSIEIFMNFYKSYVFNFQKSDQQLFLSILRQRMDLSFNPSSKKFHFFRSLQTICGSLIQTLPPSKLVEQLDLPRRWRDWEIPTFDYLYYLNLLAGRTYSDLYNYPIMPWLITDCSAMIDIENPYIYRNLGIPVPALSTAAFTTAVANSDPSDSSSCLFQELPSCEAAITSTLVRTQPFLRRYVELQLDGGIFQSVKASVDRLLADDGHKWECPPEFFTFPEAFVNENGFDLGSNGDVELPDWAATPRIFSSVSRIALDSGPVSLALPAWIDAMFGVNRRSFGGHRLYPDWAFEESATRVESHNRTRFQQQGIMPIQLFSIPHPQRGFKPQILAGRADLILPAPVRAVKKHLVLCRDGTICDLTTEPISVRLVGMERYDRLIGVSRSLETVVLTSGSGHGLVVVSLNERKPRRAASGKFRETCAAVIGGEIVVAGGNDGSVAVLALIKWKHIANSAFHAGPVVAVGGCADLGLVVSVDVHGNVVFSALDGRGMIGGAKIETGPAIICVLKSGLVAIARGAELRLFDCRGRELLLLDFDGTILSLEKYYDFGARELLIIAYESEFVTVFDLTTFTRLVTFTSAFHHPIICPVKGKRAFIVVGQGRKAQRIDFSESISTSFGRSPILEPQESVLTSSKSSGE